MSRANPRESGYREVIRIQRRARVLLARVYLVLVSVVGNIPVYREDSRNIRELYAHRRDVLADIVCVCRIAELFVDLRGKKFGDTEKDAVDTVTYIRIGNHFLFKN